MSDQINNNKMIIYKCQFMEGVNFCGCKSDLVPSGGSVELGKRFCDQAPTHTEEYIRCDQRVIVQLEENFSGSKEIK